MRYIFLMLTLCVLYHQSTALTTFKVVRRGQITDLKEATKQITDLEVDPNIGPIEDTPPEIPNPAENEIEGNEDEAVNEVIDTVSETADVPAQSNDVTPIVETAAGNAVAQATADQTSTTNVDDPNPINKYCKCSENHCDCCRNFALPIIPVRGPGCARISYLGNEKMSVQIKYGDIVLASRTVSGKNSKPICVGLPGGYSKFCGRVYGLAKTKDEFKACLGLDLRAEDEIEAALRVSCFKFGPGGLKVAEAEPLPAEVNKDEDDDDDDDFFGFGAGGGDDYDEDEDDDTDDEGDESYDEADEADDDNDDYDAANDDAAEEPDYGGITGFAANLFGDDSEEDVAPSVASRTEPEVPQNINEIAPEASSTVKPKSKKSKKKKNVEDEGFGYDILDGIISFFS